MSATTQLGQVAQVNIRLAEGGAAGIARALADGLRTRGIRSPFVYGYGRRGGTSQLHDQYDALKVTPAAIAWLNREAHLSRGQETRLHDPSAWRRMRELFEASDVIHLHAIHSYFVNPYAFLELVGDAGKPVVWTMHDSWVLTGRCAIPGDCRGWETGCVACPKLSAYPPARVDRAASMWTTRRDAIARLAERVPVVFAAIADWVAEEAVSAGFTDVRVIRNSVDAGFWDSLEPRHPQAGGTVRSLFLNRDLRDPDKVDWTVLQEAAGVSGQTLTVVGDNPPGPIPGARLLPAEADRGKLAGIFQEHDRLIVMSTVDHFSLVIAEALCAGLEVLAIDSRAARGFAGSPGVRIVPGARELIEALQEPVNSAGGSAEEFRPQRMLDEYVAVYEDLTGVGGAA